MNAEPMTAEAWDVPKPKPKPTLNRAQRRARRRLQGHHANVAARTRIATRRQMVLDARRIGALIGEGVNTVPAIASRAGLPQRHVKRLLERFGGQS